MPYRLDAMKEVFEEVTVLGKPLLFTPCRIDRNTVPKGLYMYEVRHDDDCRGDPVQDSYKTENNAFRDIDPERDWNYEGVDSTIKEYLERHPPKKEKSHER